MSSSVSSARLKDRIALVTGASRGIGFAVARRFAQEGAHVICVARTVGGLEELDDAIQADNRDHQTGGSATLVPCDLMDSSKITALGQSIADRWGYLDILTINMEIGLITPPVGLNLYVINGIVPDVSLPTVLKGAMPFVICMMLAIVILCFIPEIATWLPEMVMGKAQ